MQPLGPFTLTKWYLDCLTDAGDAGIFYSADVHWRGLHTGMASLLESPMGIAARTRFSLRGARITASAEGIVLEHPGFKIKGKWIASAPPFQQTVYEEPGGSITWNCVQPGSHVNLRIGAHELAGLGYAESVTLTVPPWRLPLRQLRWGRFVSAQHTLVWIDWQGEHAFRLALCDGHPRELGAASDAEVIAGEAALRIEPGICLRSGRLADTILPGAPALARMFPKSLFNICEHKWKSHASLRIAGEQSAGWAIHELVDWSEVH